MNTANTILRRLLAAGESFEPVPVEALQELAKAGGNVKQFDITARATIAAGAKDAEFTFPVPDGWAAIISELTLVHDAASEAPDIAPRLQIVYPDTATPSPLCMNASEDVERGEAAGAISSQSAPHYQEAKEYFRVCGSNQKINFRFQRGANDSGAREVVAIATAWMIAENWRGIQ